MTSFFSTLAEGFTVCAVVMAVRSNFAVVYSGATLNCLAAFKLIVILVSIASNNCKKSFKSEFMAF